MGRTITSQCAVYPEENILRQILGFRSVSREAVADVKNAPAVTTHKFLPGRPVALEALLDQLGILLQAKLAPCSMSPRTMILQVVYSSLPNYGT